MNNKIAFDLCAQFSLHLLHLFFKKALQDGTADSDSPNIGCTLAIFWLFTQILTQDREELLFLLQCTIRENFQMNT